MRVCTIINAFGFLTGSIQWTGMMYVCFGISFTAFFHIYAQVVWNLIYEREAHLVDVNGRMDMHVTNELCCIMVLVAVYFMAVCKLGALCVVLSTLQNMIFQLLRLKERGELERIAAIAAAGEFLISLVFLF